MAAKMERCLRTNDFSQSLRHYEEALEFRVEHVDHAIETAVIVAPAGERVLLAGPASKNSSEYFVNYYDAPKPGQAFFGGEP